MDLRDEKAQAPMGEESNILERVARIVSSVCGAKPDYAHLASELELVLPFDVFGIVLLRHDGEAVRITVCQREGEQWVTRYRQHPLVDSMVERLLLPSQRPHKGESISEEGESQPTQLLVENFPEGATGLPAECGDALCSDPRVRAALIAPLLVGGRMLGTLELGSTRLHAFADSAHQRLISALASLLATAIESVVAGGNVEIQNRQRAELKDVSTVLTTAVDLPMILQRIVLGITNSLHVSSAIVRFDQSQGCLRLEASSGLHFDPDAFHQALLMQKDVLSGQTIIGTTLRQRQKQLTQDIARDERFPQSHWFASELFIRSIFCYPLVNGQCMYGVLLLLSSEPGGFTPLKTDICALFAGQVTVAIHNEALLQSAQERRHFQELIEQLERAHQLPASFKPDKLDEAELWQRVHTQTMQTFGVSLGSVLRFISEHLLTCSERHQPAILRTAQVKREQERLPDRPAILGNGPFTTSSSADDAFCLRYSAKAALATATLFSDIGPALMRALRVDEGHPQAYEQFKHALAEPWFIIDLNGACSYLNRAAEAFCGTCAERDQASVWQRWSEESSSLFGSFHALSPCQEAPLTLEQALAPLLPRMRQEQEVLAYLRDFIDVLHEHGELAPSVSLCCTLAADVVVGQGALLANIYEAMSVNSSIKRQDSCLVIPPPSARARSNGCSPSMLLDSAPSDRHYQFVRHALYNEYGQCFANALYIHDVTEQVRDEKNKAVLLASVSHDLRTPLTCIKAAVSGLLQPDMIWDEKTRREMLEDIDAEADHLTTLVNSLVAMSQIEMGALVLDKEWCDVAEVVHAALLRCQHLLVNFTVTPRIQPLLPMVHADYVQLERVLRNLLENVARYSPKHTE
ncbi:MAG: GAF domain-containing sensor histidine kinase, partial [Ktedonobacteraceae bacterium]